METITLPSKNSVNRSPLREFLLIPFAFACFALAPQVRAVCQEGCLTNDNTVLGDDALLSSTCSDNTAIGFNALYSNTDGINNTAIGSAAIFSNTTGFDNTAIGNQALPSNTTGYLNTATGSYALQDNTTGVQNTATGGGLSHNTTGNFNTASGFNALLYNTTGGNNIALGAAAGINLTTGSYNIDIGNHGFRGEGNAIRIGKQGTQTATFIAGISGATVPTGVAVIVDSSGHLGTTTSSARFKKDIKPMDKASEAILALKPVTFRYMHEVDPAGIPQFGLVAEEVEKVNPDLVARDEGGRPYTVRYEAVNAMLLNEFLKERRKVEEQSNEIANLRASVAHEQSTNAEQQKEIKALILALNEQAGQIQKVSAQLEARKSSPEIVLNSQ